MQNQIQIEIYLYTKSTHLHVGYISLQAYMREKHVFGVTSLGLYIV